ncbi:MAG: hypothetical protein US36_C0006G0009 [Candidatus Wolfebacteria bacterium GW2011_GWC1_37_10]|uniref:DUF4878 domain-containing protein n=1 Tax=Candidatus Wolfebacteria bacterium GW2011_GWC1_37_10 TaxID=1619010 RepID=A0A0G0GAA4_9BACT|nr:MAG: hypothetical protein US36_C0006G0009 [Candidatus Wolfebacteria bacterium GW2011_GWC1_37_10]
MENQNIEKPRKTYWKFVLGFLGVILAVFVLVVGGYSVWQKIDMWRGQKAVQKFAEALKKAEQDDYQKAMADTYGGKTPQETLQMYIDAVEKGDYELASKYFIGDKQEEELRSSYKMSKSEIERYISVLKNAITKFDFDGKYDIDKKYFSLYKPILIREKIYPNGIWKIIEI